MNKYVRWWLLAGVIMILIQIVIGGITRLTGSGLSITKWEIVIGTLPPLNESAWDIAFDMYKETPQYIKINKGMTLSEFKFIYFWEYVHRLWARILGFVFIIPFIFFIIKGWIDRWLFRRLFVVILLAILVATFGWIMVASGLNERPWVNAYKLSMHLGLAMICILYLFITYLKSNRNIKYNNDLKKYKRLFGSVSVLLMLQIILGGVFAGMKASLLYPSWPLIGDAWIPLDLLIKENWNVNNFLNYDSSTFMGGFIHVAHRYLGYIVGIIIIILTMLGLKKSRQNGELYWEMVVMLTLVILQISLGVLTLLNSKGEIPLWYGSMHQLVAFLLLLVIVYIYYKIDTNKGSLE